MLSPKDLPPIQSGRSMSRPFRPSITLLMASMIMLRGSFTMPYKLSKTPLNIVLTPSQARFQSPVNVPIRKSAKPLKTVNTPLITLPIDSMTDFTIFSTILNPLTNDGASVSRTAFTSGSMTLFQITVTYSISFNTKSAAWDAMPLNVPSHKSFNMARNGSMIGLSTSSQSL
ncbi:hypothetical protein D3C75_551520 [compost metagenome]